MSLEQIIPTLFDNYFIKIIFLLHATATFLAELSLSSSVDIVIYSTYNLLFLLCVLLAIVVDRNVDIVLLATLFDGLCILFDVIVLFTGAGHGFLSIFLLIINLLMRPFSGILLLKNYSARAGVSDPTSGLLEVHVPVNIGSQGRNTYHNIDQPSQNLP